MKVRYLLRVGIFVLAALPAAGASFRAMSTPLEISDAQLEDLSASGLTAAVAEASRAHDEPVWIAYQVPGVPRHGSLCCGHGSCCEVEDSHDGLRIRSTTEDGPIVVLVRFAGGEPGRIRVISQSCPVGFAGRRVLWVGPISTQQSLELLDGWLTSRSSRLSHGALTAIAYHDDQRATSRLESVALAEGDDDLSEEAIFWLGAARREAGLEALRRIRDEDIGIERHEAVIFGLAQSPIAGAISDLITLARTDRRKEIRQEALFWLGQDGDGAAGDVIYEAALTDESLEVAEHAVFVLSQLPEPQGIELLARLLSQRQRPELRKEALFWIGQTDSDDALEIVARILNE